jgi:alanyl-tRNA synthetase
MTKTLADIRSTFLDYFVAQGHTRVDSSPLVPRNDPSLMFANSGMVQFKNVFTGAENRPYTRATSAQKSVRAGGKHNDLENVGYTARHHTFFEMLGNFSFGDYFKPEAIEFAWTLISKHFGLNKDRLLVTVYHEDEEAAALWKKIAGFSDDKIIRIKTADNFWRMGDVGPCGPCTEIFIDQGDKLQGGPPGSPDEDGDRFLEFWNIVFMQFEEQPGGGRIALPKPSVDTGMGLERMAAIMQGVHSNYDIDLFRALIGAIAELVKQNPEGPQKPSFRVIADHLRATAFLIADGVLPGNEGRGYVLRRIMRRAMRHAHLLGAREPIIYRVVPELIKQMGTAYPELIRAQGLITETIKLEETRFKSMLDRGLKLLDEETQKVNGDAALPGEVAFKLYDTFGFPLDLTQDVLRGQGKKVDTAAFEAAMQKQKETARAAWSGSGDVGTAKIWFELRDELGATEFLGYSTEKAEGQITALVKSGAKIADAKTGDEISIIVNQTPFYGESGGQMGDTGRMTTPSGAVIDITDTQKEEGITVHIAKIVKGAIKLGDVVVLDVDHARRSALRAHHSATHLLHEALRRSLGDHVAQKGSQVAPNRLRFDFIQPTPISAEALAEVEAEVNHRILLNEKIETRLMSPQEAVEQGAMALFGEKYGDEVRVLFMGGKEERQPNGKEYFSVELCGGTHAHRTGDIGLFKIISESAVSSGVRRIEAVTGPSALAWVDNQVALLHTAAEAAKTSPVDLSSRVTQLIEDRKKLEREVADLRKQLALGGSGSAGASEAPRQIGGINFISRVLPNVPAKDLKPMADAFKGQVKSGVVALVSSFEGKVSLVVAVTEDMTGTISAVDLVKAGAEMLGGKGGGGRADMAQAGGSDESAMPKAIAAIEQALAGRSKAA